MPNIGTIAKIKYHKLIFKYSNLLAIMDNAETIKINPITKYGINKPLLIKKNFNE